MLKKSNDPTSFDVSDLVSDPASDKLREKGIYYISGEIETGSLLDIQQDILLKHLDASWEDDIQLIINSCGGDCSEAWALVDLLDWIKMDVHTTGLGTCASMGAILLAAGTPGKRIAGKNTSIMVHGAFMTGIDGNYQELIAATIDMQQEFNRAIRFWKEHSSCKTDDEVKKLFLNGFDHHYTPEEALKYGLIDHITGQPKSKKKG